MSTEAPLDGQPERRWGPLSSIQRRVVGVLAEKAKTTPDSYPMTLNALTNGCNQKSNRSPQLELSTDDVEQAIEELRELGAAAEIQSGGRVAKFRHYMYEWLGVDKVELAVMAELLLRGEQTLGELRGRAARMEPIADLNTLRPIVESLIDKNLVVSLTPSGRGQVVTHNLYTSQRLEELQKQYASGRPVSEPSSSSSSSAGPKVSRVELEEVQSEVAELREEVAQLRTQIERLMGGV